jgi:hypothetical protein
MAKPFLTLSQMSLGKLKWVTDLLLKALLGKGDKARLRLGGKLDA